MIELGQWWKDQRRGLLDESPGETPTMPRSRPLGSCAPCAEIQALGDSRGCPWICGVQEHITLSAVQGWRNRDLKVRIRKSLLLITYRAGQVLQKIPWSHDLACLQKIVKSSVKMATTSLPPCKYHIHRSNERKQFSSWKGVWEMWQSGVF